MNKTKVDLTTEEGMIQHMQYQTEKSKAARLYMEENTSEAYEAFTKVLEMELDLLGEDHDETLYTRANMSVMLAQLKRFPEAEEQMRAVIQHFVTHVGENHEKTRSMKKNLANLCIELGRWQEALEILKEIRTFEKYNSIRREDKIVTLGLLGSTYESLKIWDKALESLELLRDLLINSVGEKDKETARVVAKIRKIQKRLQSS